MSHRHHHHGHQHTSSSYSHGHGGHHHSSSGYHSSYRHTSTTAHLGAFFLTFAAFVLLILVTFSAPFISTFYFLRVTVPNIGRIDFGVFGYCFIDNGFCTKETVGYVLDPQLPQLIFWLTQTLILFPISAGLCLLALISLIPPLCTHSHDRHYPSPVFAFFSLLAWLASLVGFILMIALFVITMNRFKAARDRAVFGPSPWMALGATVALTIVTLSSGCGSLCRGRYGRISDRSTYDV